MHFLGKVKSIKKKKNRKKEMVFFSNFIFFYNFLFEPANKNTPIFYSN